jgi:hypothetical protein
VGRFQSFEQALRTVLMRMGAAKGGRVDNIGQQSFRKQMSEVIDILSGRDATYCKAQQHFDSE